MNHLLRMSLVDAPFSSVTEYVLDFFGLHRHLRVKAIASTTTPVEACYELMDGRTDSARHHDAMMLSWIPRFAVFPRFEGTVTVRPHFSGSVLWLEGSYDSPAGIVGRIFDALAGQRLAYGTMDNLLGRLRTYIKKRDRDEPVRSPMLQEFNELGRLSETARP